MNNINQVELQNLKNFIEKNDTNYNKFLNYADQAIDPQIRQILNKAAQDSLNSKEKLLSFLN